jgi:small subunit ribosomal protein S16
MALVIRLRKLGAKHKPFFRIAVTEATSARDGRFVEEIGWYDPKKASANSKVDVERAKYWMSQGAKPSETVRSIFKKHGMLGAKAVVETEPEKPAARAKPAAAEAPEQAPEPQPEAAPAEEPEAPPEEPVAQTEPEPAAEAPATETEAEPTPEEAPGDAEKQE